MKILGDCSIFEQNCQKFLDACNLISQSVFKENPKSLSASTIHHKFYATMREKFDLGSQLCCSVSRYVIPKYKTLRTDKKWSLITFKKLSFPVVWKNDFNVSRRNGLTFWKQKFKLRGQSIPTSGWKDSTIKKVCGEWYLFLCVEIEVPELKKTGNAIGVDLGIKNIFVAKNMLNGKTKFCKGGELTNKKRKIQRIKSKVQSVGTRSAKRLLKRLSGKEKSVTHQLLHKESKNLVKWLEEQGARVVVFEDLTGIRKSAKKKGKWMRKSVNQWAFLNFQFMVAYKAREKGIATRFVDPAYTSKICPRCGYCTNKNRNGIYFSCGSCGFSDHADRVGANNIALKFILGEHAHEERAAVNQLIEWDCQNFDSSCSSPQARPVGS